jgi:hypothetical protein
LPAAACTISAPGSESPPGRGGGAEHRDGRVLRGFPVVGGRLCVFGLTTMPDGMLYFVGMGETNAAGLHFKSPQGQPPALGVPLALRERTFRRLSSWDRNRVTCVRAAGDSMWLAVSVESERRFVDMQAARERWAGDGAPLSWGAGAIATGGFWRRPVHRYRTSPCSSRGAHARLAVRLQRPPSRARVRCFRWRGVGDLR